jgi:prophage DNA circulation protein
MPTLFEQLTRAGFAGIEFPYETMRVRGGLRDHVHEYPHQPGGAPEKMGRKAYEFEFTCQFQGTFAQYPGLWPKRLAKLRDLWEAEATDTLVIPTIGKIKAYAFDWEQEATNKILSGERVTVKFREDQESAFLIEQLITVQTNRIKTKGDRFAKEAAKVTPREGLFDSITDAVNSVLSVVDTVQTYGNLVEAKLLNLSALCQEADQRLDALNDVTKWQLLDALHELWASSNELNQNIQRKLGKLVPFKLPFPMSIQDIATQIYGDTERVVELLQLNPIQDPFLIPAGFELRYIQAAA